MKLEKELAGLGRVSPGLAEQLLEQVTARTHSRSWRPGAAAPSPPCRYQNPPPRDFETFCLMNKADSPGNSPRSNAAERIEAFLWLSQNCAILSIGRKLFDTRMR